MASVKKCKSCMAKAAKDWKDKLCSLRWNSDPGARAVHPFDVTNSNHYSVTSNHESTEHGTRGRRRTRSYSRDSQHTTWSPRIPSRSRSLPGSVSTKVENSPLPHYRLPIPDPNIVLPIHQPTFFCRYNLGSDLKLSSRMSRSCLIKASCIPQVEWTRADCRDWIAACFREVFEFSAPCALKKACKQMEAGAKIYHTPIWTWEERWPYSGKTMYYRLQECRNKGLVRGLRPSIGHREFIPVEFRWEHGEGSKE